MEPPSAPPTTTPPPPPITTTTPPPPPPTTITAPTYPDSLDSSPRSRTTDFDDTLPPSAKLRLLCSYGGHIVPRPHDKSLCYVGGDTRIVVVDRTSTLSDLLSRLSKTLLNSRPFTLKYQLPNEDLDSLITVSTEEDLDNMIDEYDRLISTSNPAKPGRIRLFLFPSKPEGASSIGSILDGSNRSEDWFLNALNGAGALQRGFSDPASVNSLLGLDDGGLSKGVKNQNQNQEIHSVPDSPIVETSSSFGSTSSSPSLANLPPIRVHVEPRVGIEDQFGNLGIGVQKQVDEGFVAVNSPKGNLAPATAVMSGVFMGGGGGGVYSDDERSDHGGYRKQQQQQTMGQPVVMPTQTQLKQMSGGGGGELPSPDSVSSDSSLSNAMARQKPVYQDPVSQLSSGSSRIPPNLIDPNTRIQLQQVSETGYALPPQFEQHQQQLLQQQIQQQHMQQQQQQQQQQQHHQQQLGQTQPLPQPQQYIPSGGHFVHHTPTGAVPLSTYYQMYPPQQSHHHPQYPVYYVPAGQSQAYSLPVQQPNMGETATAVPSSRPQTPPNPTMITPSSAYNQARNVPAPKPDMSGVYRTAAGPQLVQVPSSQSQPQSQSQSQPQAQPQAPPPQQQQQFMGYSQIHHPSQSIAPTSAANAGYAFEFADPAHAQVYYTQPLPPNLAAQYQAMNPGTTMVMPDGSSQHGSDNLKQQQIRSSQPL